jgi:hypothetical protein
VIVEMREYTLHAAKVPEYPQKMRPMLVEQRNGIMRPTSWLEPELRR